jgi:hypothetical protein
MPKSHPQYRIERSAHGLAVFGCLRLNDLSALITFAQAIGCTVVDQATAVRIGAALVLTRPEAAARWRAEVGALADALLSPIGCNPFTLLTAPVGLGGLGRAVEGDAVAEGEGELERARRQAEKPAEVEDATYESDHFCIV